MPQEPPSRSDPRSKPEPEPESTPKTRPEAKPEPGTTPQPEPKPKSDPKPEPKPETLPNDEGISPPYTLGSDPTIVSCEDFGEILRSRRASMYWIDSNGSRASGFFLEAEGGLWFAAPSRLRESLETGFKVNSMRSDPSGSLDVASRRAVLAGNPPSVALFDLSDLRERLSPEVIAAPPLIDSTRHWRAGAIGNLLLTAWWETSPSESLWARLVRVESLPPDPDGLATLRFAPPLPPSSLMAPMLDRGGCLAGIVACSCDESAPIDRAISAAQVLEAIQRRPLRWKNQEGLQDLVATLKARGFTHLAYRRVRTAETGSFETRYESPVTGIDRAAVAFVCEDPAQSIRLEATRGRTCETVHRPGPDEATPPPFEPGPRGVYLEFRRLDNSDGVMLGVQTQNGRIPASLLEIHAVAESEETADLPTIDVLLDLPRFPTGTRDTALPGGGEETSEAKPGDPMSLPPPDYSKADPDGPLLRIPLRGTVGFCGEDDFFTAQDFKLALRRAAAERPAAVILEIESPGGRVDSSREIIVELLQAQRSGMRVVADVRDAGSAAALITLACKEILARPGARVGAAVTIQMAPDGSLTSLKKLSQEQSDPELDRKFESFEAATHREAASVSGHSPLLAPAMRHSERELYWFDGSGSFSDRRMGTEDEEMVDGPETVLTLTCPELVRFGIAKEILGDSEAANRLGLGGRAIELRDEDIRRTFRVATAIIARYQGDLEAASELLVPLLQRP
jgi:hypothetical protein